MGLYHLLYQSQALASFSLPELLGLLHQSRTYNAARGITGMLLHAPNGQFLQLLEGEKGAVQHLYHRIAADPRHEHLTVLSEGPNTTQVFSDWSMSFRSGAGLVALPGYLAPSAAYFRVSNLPHALPGLKRLLLDFTAGYDDSPMAESMIGSQR